jgi:polyisoprenoid-binding protein YceI
MSVVKIIDVMADSSKSLEGAVQTAVFKAAKSLQFVKSVSVSHITITAMLILFSFGTIEAQKTYRTNKGYVSFFANAPVADVDARNPEVTFTLNTSTGELGVYIDMSDFQFQNDKMGRDAQKNYIEIDKFPKASFIGKITGKVDYDKPGTYPVTARGKLKIHGTEKEISEKGTIKVEKGKINIDSNFNVALRDYNIETPKILGQEMTEDKVMVKIEATLSADSKSSASK